MGTVHFLVLGKSAGWERRLRELFPASDSGIPFPAPVLRTGAHPSDTCLEKLPSPPDTRPRYLE